MVSAGGGCEAAVTDRIRRWWVEFMVAERKRDNNVKEREIHGDSNVWITGQSSKSTQVK